MLENRNESSNSYSDNPSTLLLIPKISVIIPVFNAENYLKECLDSVLNQSIKDIEVICVNDCSTDGSLNILKEYQKKDSRIKIINNSTNLHAGPCRNAGLELCTGEYIHFLDADDILIADAYENLYDQAKTHDVDLLRCKAYSLDSVTLEVGESPYLSLSKVPSKYFDRVLNFSDYPELFTSLCVAPWAGLYRRKFLIKEKLRFNSLICVNDRSFYAQTIFCAKRILISSSYILNYRTNNSKSLVGNRAKYFRCHFDSYNIIFESSKDLPTACRKIYLTSELNDIVFWLEKFSDCEYAEKIKKDTGEFLLNLDLSIWDYSVVDQGWYQRIYKQCSEYLGDLVTPRITVIMPIFNAKSYVESSIRSVLKQTIRDLELICIDDGSTDGSYEIALEWARKDTRVSVYRQDHLYAGTARNKGLDHARGEYVTFLDSDDLFFNTALESLYNCAKQKSADVVISKARWFAHSVKQSKPAPWVFNENLLKNFECLIPTDFNDKIFQISSGEPWSKLFKLSFIRQHQIAFPPLPRSEDVYFVYLAYALAEKIALLNKETVFYRKIPGHGIESQKDTYPTTSCQVRILLKKQLDELGLYDKYKHSFVNRTIDAVIYNLRGCSSVRSAKEIYQIFKYEMIPSLDIDLTDGSYFLNKKNYEITQEIMVTNDFQQLWHDKLEKRLGISDYAQYISKWYREKTHQNLNLLHPASFNEKVQWLKLFDTTPLKTELADKFRLRDWVAKQIGEKYLIPIYGIYECFEQIQFNSLPNSIVLRCTHGPAYSTALNENNKFEIKEVQGQIQKCLLENFGLKEGFQLQYLDVYPRILIEKNIEEELKGNVQKYRFWCFGGVPKYVQLFTKKSNDWSKSVFFDVHWNKQTFISSSLTRDEDYEKPINFLEMFSLAKKLSHSFPLALVDFYQLGNREILFSDLLFLPEEGLCKWKHEGIDRKLGKLIRLPKTVYDFETHQFCKFNSLEWKLLKEDRIKKIYGLNIWDKVIQLRKLFPKVVEYHRKNGTVRLLKRITEKLFTERY